MEPAVGIGRRLDSLFELSCPFRPQVLPGVDRVGDVLDGVKALLRGRRPEIERTEVDRLVPRPIDDVEGDAQEAPLGDILAPQIHVDHAVAELHAVEQRAAVASTGVQARHRALAFLLGRQAAVEDLRALSTGQTRQIGLDWCRGLGWCGRRQP